MEYVVGPVLALLISMKFTAYTGAKKDEQIKSLQEQIELCKASKEEADKEVVKKVMTTMMPIAKAVNRINGQLGL